MVEGTHRGAIKKKGSQKEHAIGDESRPHMPDESIDGKELGVHKPSKGVENADNADSAASANSMEVAATGGDETNSIDSGEAKKPKSVQDGYGDRGIQKSCLRQRERRLR